MFRARKPVRSRKIETMNACQIAEKFFKKDLLDTTPEEMELCNAPEKIKELEKIMLHYRGLAIAFAKQVDSPEARLFLAGHEEN